MRSVANAQAPAQVHERGATVIEYGLLIAMIAVAVIAGVSLMSSSISSAFLAAAEPFSDAQTATPTPSPQVRQVRAGKSVTLDVAQLSGLKNAKDVKVKATVDSLNGKVEGKDNGTIKFEAAERASGSARITYTYSYKQGKDTVKGGGSMLVDIVR